MKKWYEILWGSREEDELVQRVKKLEKHADEESDKYTPPDPDDLTIENAYKTRWIWYHTILGILMMIINILLIAILTLLAIKL